MRIDPTSTLNTLTEALRAARTEARAARIREAKTNIDYLIETGVLVTEDTAFDNAMAEQGVALEAARRGVSVDVIRAEREAANLRSDVLQELRRAVKLGETPTEHAERRHAALAAAVGYRDSGRRCDHKRTAKSAGWINKYGYYNMAMPDPNLGGWTFLCTKCQAEAHLPKLAEPTEQVELAAALLVGVL